MVCTKEKLEQFSLEHFTFINQFFGDETVREVIAECFPNDKYEFKIEKVGHGAFHHVLIGKTNGTKEKRVCSFEKGHQNMETDKNDTLCQSYSLLTYLGVRIKKDKKQKQIDMVAMYEALLEDKEFKKKLSATIDIPNAVWKDYSKVGAPAFTMTKSAFFSKVKQVLKKWKEYGYWYFIGDGTCPSE